VVVEIGTGSLAALNRAIKDEDADRAWAISCSLRVVPLRFAARLVQLLMKKGDTRFDLAARRFMIRVLEEIEPERASLLNFKKLADILAHVDHHYHRHAARAGLSSVVGQMHDRDRRLSLEFDSEEEIDWR
jgi:hypothetical protein